LVAWILPLHQIPLFQPYSHLTLPMLCDNSSLVESHLRSPLLEPTLSWLDYQLVDCWIRTSVLSSSSISLFEIHPYSSQPWITYHRRFHLALLTLTLHSFEDPLRRFLLPILDETTNYLATPFVLEGSHYISCWRYHQPYSVFVDLG